MDLYYKIVLFVLGINLGSFYNVVGYRLPKGESILFPPSHCPKCNHKLAIYELIPIFSYIFQVGKCRKCKTKISFFYPIFELATGLLFVLAYSIFGLSIELLIGLIFISMTLIIFISDYLYYIILDEVLIVSSGIFLILIFFLNGIEGVGSATFNGIIAFCIMFLIKQLGDFLFKKESMGGGDIKLMFVFGLVFGFEMSLVSIFIASFIGLPISLFMLFFKQNDERIIPFGPFLCLAGLIILFFKIDINTVFEIIMINS
ncbi:MAG: prepilin peptidase [Bacilli bacterium]|nr:prepilin peptidase [Bacilli bacterium]MDD4283089.1 prepilin peptidase [Bacilli bacterium]MDD4719063.1 prepilin peptidase [Bacilli bacterium]